jgi:lipopolysaccharide export system protein LptC
MAVTMDRYSRLVAWLKIILPLVALAMLSTIFLVSRTIDPSQSIPYSDVDVQGLAEGQAITEPSFAGVTTDGASIRFTALSVHPQDGDLQQLIAREPRARIDLPTGQTVNLTSPAGKVDRTVGTARLSDGVEVTTSDGYRMVTDAATTTFDAAQVTTDGAVDGAGPLGTLKAGKAVLKRTPDGSYVLRFEKGVNLLYRPAG